MENPEKQKPPFKFPPYRRRRRPLYSHSFSTFIRILTHCQHVQLHTPEKVATVQGHQLVENNFGLTIQGDRSVTINELRPEDGLVIENRRVVSSQGPGFIGERVDIDALDSRDNDRSNDDQGNVEDINGIKSVVQGDQDGNSDCGFATLALLNNSDEQLLKSDVLAGALKYLDYKEEKSSPLERNNMEMQMKGRESDTPVSAPVLTSFSLQKMDACIGDGEISENSGVPDNSSNLLREDVVSLEKNIVNKGQFIGDLTQKERFSQNAPHRGIDKENKSDELSRSGVNIMSTAIDVQMRTDNTNLAENRCKLVYYGDIVADERAEGQGCKSEFGRNRRRCGFAEVNSQSSCLKNLTLSGGSTGENTVENECSTSTEKGTNLNNKKRKRGPGSEDRKARKKKKERMKRAEKERKLGVKRLKLPPVTNPKTIKYCRHFVKGRCHEGEKCKFSHATLPLTKSKACSHFARQSCMKGDDCSYDHQLSKYPCNNYLSTGSCSRGSNCMFSHDVVPVKEGCSTSEQQSLGVRETSNLKKPTSKRNVNAKSCSRGISLSENEKHNGCAEQVPNGISFLWLGKVPLGSMSENGKSALSLKADKGTKVDQQRTSGASDLVVSWDKNTQRTPAGPPRRVNFLSFGKAPFESSGSKRSSFSSISNLETGKSPISDPEKREHAGSSLNAADDAVKVDSQIGGGASSTSTNLNELANRTLAMTPRGLSFLSLGNHLESSVNEKLAGSHFNEANTVLPTDKINGSVNIKVHSRSLVLPQSLSSLPRKFSLSKLIDVQSKISLNANTPSSVQKAVRSTLTLAAKFESKNNKDHSCVAPAISTDLNKEGNSSQKQSSQKQLDLNKEGNSSQKQSSQKQLAKASTILDLLYGANSK